MNATMDVRHLSDFLGFSAEKLQKHNLFKSERFFLDVYCLTLRRREIGQLLAEFRNPGQQFRVLLVKGSPFVSLSISPTKAAID